jgi:hypothetical protein
VDPKIRGWVSWTQLSFCSTGPCLCVDNSHCPENLYLWNNVNLKAVPLHAMEALGGEEV